MTEAECIGGGSTYNETFKATNLQALRDWECGCAIVYLQT
jgi:hypothetical protein